MNWVKCKACINKCAPDNLFEGKCPECQVEHLRAIALDEHNTKNLRRAVVAKTEAPVAANEQAEAKGHAPIKPHADAIIQAAHELAGNPGAKLNHVIRRAAEIRGKNITSGYLSPNGPNASLRAQVEEILGIAPAPDLAAEVARLEAELAQLRAAAPEPRPQAPSLAEGLRQELAKDRRTLEAIERDRQAVLERIAAAELLLSTLDGEPAQSWQVLKGGAHRQEVA